MAQMILVPSGARGSFKFHFFTQAGEGGAVGLSQISTQVCLPRLSRPGLRDGPSFNNHPSVPPFSTAFSPTKLQPYICMPYLITDSPGQGYHVGEPHDPAPDKLGGLSNASTGRLAAMSLQGLSP
jgi:hypothetical protein